MQFLTLIKYDFLKRVRSYTFLITMCASIAIAYTFIPAPEASYSTIKISNYIGEYNSAWFGYVSGIMSSVLLSLIGFYFVSGEIKTDKSTKVGQIMATTQIGNSRYLFIKVLSNFLLLLTIVSIIFLMSITIFFIYSGGHEFEILNFLKPYLVLTLPVLFFIAVLAVIFEVVFGKYRILQNIVFFVCFTSLLVYKPETRVEFAFDLFGDKIVANHLEKQVSLLTGSNEPNHINIGYTFNDADQLERFTFSGFNFPSLFLVSRILWICLGIVFILCISPFFHRFDIKNATGVKKKSNTRSKSNFAAIELSVKNLPSIKPDFSVLPLIKIEFLMLFRKGKRWLWVLNILGMVLLSFLPLDLAHKIILPVLWFLQVHRLSDLTTKEMAYDVHYLSFSSKSPVKRLLNAQLIAAVILICGLSFPLIVRYALTGNFLVLSSILLGGIFLVLLAGIIGLLSKGKKLFEVVFFLITYSNINSISFLDYLGALNTGTYKFCIMGLMSIVMLLIVYGIRRWNLISS